MKNSKLINALFALDLWIASTVITTMISNMLLSNDHVLLITVSLVCACVNAIFWSIFVISLNSRIFSKRTASKGIMRN